MQDHDSGAKQLRSAATNKAKFKARNKQKEEAIRKKKKKERMARARIPYRPDDRILLIGEGDFSFTAAVAKHLTTEREKLKAQERMETKELENGEVLKKKKPKDGWIIATCLDSKEEIARKYPSAAAHVETAKQMGAIVVEAVDGTDLEDSKGLKHAVATLEARHGSINDAGETHGKLEGSFTKIVFNFPHTGCGIKDTEKNNLVHRKLLTDFLNSATKCLLPHASSEIHITLKKGEPYESWGLSNCAKQLGVLRMKRADEFFPHLYPGYAHRRTLGAAFRSEEEGGPQLNHDIMKIGARTYVLTLNK